MSYSQINARYDTYVTPNGDDTLLLDNQDGSSDYIMAGGNSRPFRIAIGSATGTISVGDDYLSDYRYNYSDKAETWAHGGKSGGTGSFNDFEAFSASGGASGVVLHEQSDTHICLLVTSGTLSATETITGGTTSTQCTISGSNLDNTPVADDSITNENSTTGTVTTVDVTSGLLTINHANPNSDTSPSDTEHWWAWDGADASTMSGSVLTADSWNFKVRIWEVLSAGSDYLLEGLKTALLESGETLTKDGNDAIYHETTQIDVCKYTIPGLGYMGTGYDLYDDIRDGVALAAHSGEVADVPCRAIVASHNIDHEAEASVWAHGGVTGTFDAFEPFTASGGATGIVLAVDGTHILLYVATGSVGNSDDIDGDDSSAQVTLDGNPPSTNNMPASGTVDFSNGETGTIEDSTPASNTFEFFLDSGELPTSGGYFSIGSGGSMAGSKITGYSDLQEGEEVTDGSLTCRVSTRRKSGTYIVFAPDADADFASGTLTGGTTGHTVTFDSYYDMYSEFGSDRQRYVNQFAGLMEVILLDRLTGEARDLSGLSIVERESRFAFDQNCFDNGIYRMHSGRIYSIEEVYDHINDETFASAKMIIENTHDIWFASGHIVSDRRLFTNLLGRYLIAKNDGLSVDTAYQHPAFAKLVAPRQEYSYSFVHIFPGTYGVPETPAFAKTNGYAFYGYDAYVSTSPIICFYGDVIFDGSVGANTGEYGMFLTDCCIRIYGSLTIKNFNTTALKQVNGFGTYPLTGSEVLSRLRVFDCTNALDIEDWDDINDEISNAVFGHITDKVFKDTAPAFVKNCTFDDCGGSLSDDDPIFDTEGFKFFYNNIVSNCTGKLVQSSAPWGGNSDGTTDNEAELMDYNCFFSNSISGYTKLGYTSTNPLGFTTSDSITGSSSGTQGDIEWVGDNYLLVEITAGGPFTTSDSVIGSSSGATADIDSVASEPVYPADLDNNSDYVPPIGTNDIYTNPIYLDPDANLYGLRYESDCCHPAGFGRIQIGAYMESYGDSNNIRKRIDLTGAVPGSWAFGDTVTDTTKAPNTTGEIVYIGSEFVIVDNITCDRSTHGDEPFSNGDTITDGTTGATVDSAELITWVVEDGYSTGNKGWVDVDKAGGGSNAFELDSGMISSLLTPPDDADLDSPVFEMAALATNQIRHVRSVEIHGQETQYDTVNSEDVGKGNEWGHEVIGGLMGGDLTNPTELSYAFRAADAKGTLEVFRAIPIRTNSSTFNPDDGVIDWLKALQTPSRNGQNISQEYPDLASQCIGSQYPLRGNDIYQLARLLFTDIAIEGNDPREANFVQLRLRGNARL
jgi:hypothetical protein